MGKKSGGRVRVKQMGPKGSKMMGNPLDALGAFGNPQEMIQLPPKPDPNISSIWPLGETFTMDYKRFMMVYPNFLDSTKTVRMGRRIAAHEAVPTPTALDIGHALQSLRIRHVVQPYKNYSRDAESHWDNPGRVLVDLPNHNSEEEDGVVEMTSTGEFDISNNNDENTTTTTATAKNNTKRALLKELARIIPELPSRKLRIEREEKAKEEAAQKAAQEKAAQKVAAQQKSSSSSSSPNTKNKKKKGKKKR